MKISIVGSAGVPANYGGFETLVENLARYHNAHYVGMHDLIVYCSAKNYINRNQHYLGASLCYLPISANGISSIIYDAWSIIHAILNKSNVILILGVSGSLVLPFVKPFTQARFVINIDGIEWQRDKWKGFSKDFLRASERWAVRYSDAIIADNQGIADYVLKTYGIQPNVIAYGGDHALECEEKVPAELNIPHQYALSVCRIEPENNIHLILDAFSFFSNIPIVFVGNWSNSKYGRSLLNKYKDVPNIILVPPIYESGYLRFLRSHASVYVHGHSAGGTNPSLVEAMHFGVPIIAFDCKYNRFTTEGKAYYFKDAIELSSRIMEVQSINSIGDDMRAIARNKYTWKSIAKNYFSLMFS